MTSYNLCLNFVSLLHTDFPICCYRKPVANESDEKPFDDVCQHWLPYGDDDRKSGQKYWIGLVPREGWEEFRFSASENAYAALWVLKKILLPDFARYIKANYANYVVEHDDGLFSSLDVKLKRYDEGWRGVRLELQWLKESHQLGLLINYKFFVDKDNETIDRHKILELSFSSDEDGRSNKNFAVDTYKWESAFLRKVVVPYECAVDTVLPEKLRFNSAFSSLTAFVLASRTYDFKNGGVAGGQYSGLLRFGPCEPPPTLPKYYFVFRHEDRMAARSLYKALAGRTYPERFPGVERVFKVPFSGDAVTSYEVDDFSRDNLEKAAEHIKNNGGENPVCIVLADDDPRVYYRQKAIFLSRRIATQHVCLKSVLISKSFEWYIAGIALQVFCKSMGRPWKVRTKNSGTLIVGISQVFGRTSGGQHRYVSYSVTTDASGVFKDIRTLADENTQESYLEKLASNLEVKLSAIANDTTDRVTRIVLHCSFRLPYEALKRIRATAEKVAGMQNAPQIVILRINTDHQYSGYDLSQASLVPRECSFVSLGGGKYILWCDGAKKDQSIYKRPNAPIHVNFDYSYPEISSSDRMTILEDISNLAGANWRGFNASTRPVSVFYCRIVGEFIKEFTERSLPIPAVEEFMPWFL